MLRLYAQCIYFRIQVAIHIVTCKTLLFTFVLQDGRTSGIYYSFYKLCSVCDLLIYSQLVTVKDTTLVLQLLVKKSYTEFRENSV